jgi:hypothetical protein
MWQSAIQGQTQGVWFWAAFYIFILCVYSLVLQIRTRYWPYAEGVIVESSVEKFRSASLKTDQNFIANALYKYNVSGLEYNGTRISPWIIVASHNAKFILAKQMSAIQRLPDGKVKVFYNPNKPRKSFLAIASKLIVCITLFLGALPSFIIILF